MIGTRADAADASGGDERSGEAVVADSCCAVGEEEEKERWE